MESFYLAMERNRSAINVCVHGTLADLLAKWV